VKIRTTNREIRGSDPVSIGRCNHCVIHLLGERVLVALVNDRKFGSDCFREGSDFIGKISALVGERRNLVLEIADLLGEIRSLTLSS
jgi:hypothetical protein